MTFLKVAVAALALAFPAAVGVPALAQNSLTYSDSDGDDLGQQCMSRHRVVDFATKKGYSNIKTNPPRGSLWQLKGEKNGRLYLILVDTCRNTIVATREVGTN